MLRTIDKSRKILLCRCPRPTAKFPIPIIIIVDAVAVLRHGPVGLDELLLQIAVRVRVLQHVLSNALHALAQQSPYGASVDGAPHALGARVVGGLRVGAVHRQTNVRRAVLH